MKPGLVVLAVFAVLSSAAIASADPRTYSVLADGKSAATFRYDDPVETVDGSATRVSGAIIANLADVTASSVAVSVELASISTGIDMRDSHIREEFVESGKFPRASFRSVSVAPATAPVANKPSDLTVTGDFELHGVTKRITVPVRVVVIPETELTRAARGAGDWLHVTTTFPLLLSDFGIAVPKSFVADRIEVKLDLFAVAK